jgi:hypothetical protein
MFSNLFFSEIALFMRKCGKILYSLAGHGWQYGACALHAGDLRLQIHTHTHTHTNKHKRTDCEILIAFRLQQCLYGHTSMLRNMYTPCLVIFTLTRSLAVSQHKISTYIKISIRSPSMRGYSSATARSRRKIRIYGLESSGIWTLRYALQRRKTVSRVWLGLCIRTCSIVQASELSYQRWWYKLQISAIGRFM